MKIQKSNPKVEQFHVKNQFLIKEGEKTFFQSYTSIIAVIDSEGSVTLDEKYWDYSKTTSRYRNLFLGENKKATEKKIKSGKYKMCDLN